MELDLNERDRKYIAAFWALEAVHDCDPKSVEGLTNKERDDLFKLFEIFDETDRSEFEIRDIALSKDPDLERRGFEAFDKYSKITKMRL